MLQHEVVIKWLLLRIQEAKKVHNWRLEGLDDGAAHMTIKQESCIQILSNHCAFQWIYFRMSFLYSASVLPLFYTLQTTWLVQLIKKIHGYDWVLKSTLLRLLKTTCLRLRKLKISPLRLCVNWWLIKAFPDWCAALYCFLFHDYLMSYSETGLFFTCKCRKGVAAVSREISVPLVHQSRTDKRIPPTHHTAAR